MSVDYLSPAWEDQPEITPKKSHLPSILAKQILESGEAQWRPDFLSRQLADEIAWEIGARAMVIDVHLKGVRSSQAGDSYGITLRPDNVVDLHKRR
ncbi:MAG TPA: hypothetical protein VFL81_03015 [Candidatus Saccharimonadales bacterium]|nr:hypothetical protein [Candidatus Saccharimonadales bacterium]